MNDLQIAAVAFIASLVCGFFHFSGYVAGRGVQKDDYWPALGGLPVILVVIVALASLIIMIINAFIHQPPTP